MSWPDGLALALSGASAVASSAAAYFGFAEYWRKRRERLEMISDSFQLTAMRPDAGSELRQLQLLYRDQGVGPVALIEGRLLRPEAAALFRGSAGQKEHAGEPETAVVDFRKAGGVVLGANRAGPSSAVMLYLRPPPSESRSSSSEDRVELLLTIEAISSRRARTQIRVKSQPIDWTASSAAKAT